jgi:hypothetical protein
MPHSWHQQKDDNAQKGTQRCTRQSNTVKHSLNIFFVYVLKRPVLALLKTTSQASCLPVVLTPTTENILRKFS